MSIKLPFWVVSDTHWFHNNIVTYSGRDSQIAWLLGPDTAKRIDHNEFMVERWNEAVGPDDRVLHLGDVYFWRNPGREKFEEEILPRLNGDKYLILGNHDKDKPSVYERMGFKVIKPFGMKINGRQVTFDHYPLDRLVEYTGTIHVHGHIHNSGYSLTDDRHDHRSTPMRLGHMNVSVEMIDYTPQLITDLIQ